jgi:site-specific DNA recombinase
MLSTMRAIGYVRVSTDKQADRGVSLDAQMEKIRAMAVVQGAELVDILVDGSESANNRPGMARLLVWYIMTAVSQWEREAIGERTRDAMRHKRSNGERVGNIAYGYRLAADGQRLEPDPREQAVLSAIRELRERRCPMRGIAAELNARGWRTRRASAW